MKAKQSNEERRKTRLQYRKIQEETQTKRALMVDPLNTQFVEQLSLQNQLYEHVHHPNEAFLDIQQTSEMTLILKEQVLTLANEQFTFTPNDYIAALVRNFGVNAADDEEDIDDDDDDDKKQIDWAAVGERFAPWFLSVAPIRFMSGPLQQSGKGPLIKKQKAPRKVRKKQQFKTDAPVVQPSKVSEQAQGDKTETKSRVEHLKKVLRAKCEAESDVNPLAFLVNPDSYSQTVENLFDMSFIMKQGYAQMMVSRDTKQPSVSYISRAERQRRQNVRKDAETNGQCIVKMNPSNFMNVIEAYDITESQIERLDAAPEVAVRKKRPRSSKEEAD